MAKYNIDLYQTTKIIPLLNSCNSQISNTEKTISKVVDCLQTQSGFDLYKISIELCILMNTIDSITGDIGLLSEALAYVEYKSGDADQLAYTIFHNRISPNKNKAIDEDTENATVIIINDNGEDDNTIHIIPTIRSEDGQKAPDGLTNYPYSNESCNYNGNNYDDFWVLPGFNKDACMNQNELDHPDRSIMCTSTAQSIAYLIKNGVYTDPRSTWNGQTKWTYSDSLTETKTWTEAQKLEKTYELITNGSPVILSMESPSWHTVTVVGIQKGADINNLSYDDFLIVDPWDGKVKKLSEQSRTIGDNSGWSLKIPK